MSYEDPFAVVRVLHPCEKVSQDSCLILIVEECILLHLYTIKHDNHVTLLATIYLRANTTHVFIFTACFGCDAPS
jgi:hypothetical protein